MLTSAKNLAQCYLQIQSGASTLLEEAVQTGDLKLAWEVFRELQEVLPKLDWVPSRERYPEFRKLLDSDEFCVDGICILVLQTLWMSRPIWSWKTRVMRKFLHCSQK